MNVTNIGGKCSKTYNLKNKNALKVLLNKEISVLYTFCQHSPNVLVKPSATPEEGCRMHLRGGC